MKKKTKQVEGEGEKSEQYDDGEKERENLKDQSIVNYLSEISSRRENFVTDAFDSIVVRQDTRLLYLHEIKNKTRMPFKNYTKRRNSISSRIVNDKRQQQDDSIKTRLQVNKKTYLAKLLVS